MLQPFADDFQQLFPKRYDDSYMICLRELLSQRKQNKVKLAYFYFRVNRIYQSYIFFNTSFFINTFNTHLHTPRLLFLHIPLFYYASGIESSQGFKSVDSIQLQLYSHIEYYMLNFNFFENIQEMQSDHSIPRLIDFITFQPPFDQGHNFFQDQLLIQPISPPLFQQRQLVQPVTNPLPISIPGFQPINIIRQADLIIPNNIGQQESQGVGRKNKKIRPIKLQTCKIKATKQCPICLQDIKINSKIPALVCKHEFHKKCLTDWIQKKRKQNIEESCPFCRLQICCD